MAPVMLRSGQAFGIAERRKGYTTKPGCNGVNIGAEIYRASLIALST